MTEDLQLALQLHESHELELQLVLSQRTLMVESQRCKPAGVHPALQSHPTVGFFFLKHKG